MMCGISETQTRELTQSLGLKLGKIGALAGELSTKFGISTTISEQRNVTDTVTLRNDDTQVYRLYARWFVRHEITVERLEITAGQALPTTEQGWWEALNGTSGSSKRSPICKVSYTSPSDVMLTYCEVEKPRS
jgi:hypothetical protein